MRRAFSQSVPIDSMAPETACAESPPEWSIHAPEHYACGQRAEDQPMAEGCHVAQSVRCEPVEQGFGETHLLLLAGDDVRHILPQKAPGAANSTLDRQSVAR